MRRIGEPRRLLILVLAMALLAGALAWRVSATAQAHRGRPATSPAVAATAKPIGRRTPQRPGSVRFLRPGGRMLGTICSERVFEVFGGSAREVMPAEPLRPLPRCGGRVLPPGYSVPLGR